ncbi:MAG TPA: heme-binding domain-containing protein [Flavihumibacter sp.]|nr:heme-binding domain-containing protein [Flavihumibacter sp.]
MRRFFFLLILVLIVLQLFRPDKSNVSASPSKANINNFVTVPAEIDQLLKTSCYDCHSNNTSYPWYANVQPVGWWLSHHVNEGKNELNFDAFGDYTLRRKYHKLEEIDEMIEQEDMPLTSYTLIHKNAKLSAEQKTQLIAWSEKARKEMEEIYPIDSLKRK